MQTLIRPATPDDAAACRAIARAAYAAYVPLMGRAPAPMLADYAAHIARDTVFVLEADDALLGYAVILDDGGRYWLDNIAVATGHQGHGLGRRLIEHTEAWLAARTDRYRLYTNQAMTTNDRWYRALGFTEYWRGEVDGYARIYFEKRLRA